MLAGLDGELFGWESESVPSHRMQNVEAAHPLVTSEDVGGGVSLHMADVQPLAARIRKHVEHVILGLCCVEAGIPWIGRAKHSVGQPA